VPQPETELAGDALRGELQQPWNSFFASTVHGHGALWSPARQGDLEARDCRRPGVRGQGGIYALVRSCSCRDLIASVFVAEGELGEVQPVVRAAAAVSAMRTRMVRRRSSGRLLMRSSTPPSLPYVPMVFGLHPAGFFFFSNT
jgi:hypothetical protein